jgi:hypothetical protein
MEAHSFCEYSLYRTYQCFQSESWIGIPKAILVKSVKAKTAETMYCTFIIQNLFIFCIS